MDNSCVELLAVLDVWATVVAVMKCKICMAHVL